MNRQRLALRACFALLGLLLPISAAGAIIKTELAGNSLAQYPFFEYVRAFNVNAAVKVAIDPTQFPSIVGKTCDIYVVNHKSPSDWSTNPALVDVTPGGALTQTFGGTTIQANTFEVAAASTLNANAAAGLGVPYDVVLDCDRNGSLSDGDFIDGLSGEAGLYMVSDTTAPGPFAVTEIIYNLDSGVAASFGIPGNKLGEDLYFPTNIAAMGSLPLVTISRGNGHDFRWYDHIGKHLASYGYIVMSGDNDTEPGPKFAATTTLGHTDAFIDQAEAGAIASGQLVGHVDSHRIVWIGHSRGAEGVAIAYDSLFDGTVTPTHYGREDIRLISSMLPTDFNGTNVANPHDANYHLWTASGDADVDGSADCDLCQTFHLVDRATGYKQSTIVQGTGHGEFHDEPAAGDVFDGPCPIGRANTHLIQLGYFLPLIKHYVEGNVPALDFLTRQYESFHPIGVSTADPCIVVTDEYRNGAAVGNFIIDDYQTQTANNVSSSGGAVTFDVENLTEGRLDDNNSDFTWTSSDPFNGATQGSSTDATRGVVFDWTDADHFYDWQVTAGGNDFTRFKFLSFRGAQGTQHPNTTAELGDLTFAVTVRDGNGVVSRINIGAYGGGLEEPYQRNGGWHNEMETIRIRTRDFANNGGGIDLTNIVAVRLDVGPSFGSSKGRIVIDDLMLTNDLSPNSFGSDLSITKTDSPDPVTVGNNLTYTVTVTNNGPDTAISVTVTDNLPAETAFVSCFSTGEGVCGGSGNNRTVTFASLASGETETITFVASVNCSVADGTVISNTATVSSSTPDPDATNDSATATTTASNPPPAITGAAADPSLLWPPNHRMVNVNVSYQATDNCPLPPNSCTLSVTSNEPINGTGDGDTSPDWIILDAHHVQLRAERAGNGNGRIYTITITCTDNGGNSSHQSVTVSVPHDRGRR